MDNQSIQTVEGQDHKQTLVAMLLGGLLLAWLQQTVRPTIPEIYNLLNLALLALGLALFLLGSWSLERGKTPAWLVHGLSGLGRLFSATPTQGLLLIYAILLAVTVLPAAGHEAKMINPIAAIASWLAAIGCVVAASGIRLPQGSSWFKLPGKEIAWLAGIFIVSFLLRGINTATIPITLTGDEGAAGLFSVSILKGEFNNPFISAWFSFPSLFFFFQALGIQLIGQTSAGLRIPTAMIGALTVVATYLFTRSLYGRRAALFASVLLAFAHLHIHFSRIGLNNVWDGLSFVVVLGALWYGYKNNHRAAMLLAGLALGFSQTMYSSARVLALLVALWIALMAIRDHSHFRKVLPSLLLMGVAAVVVALPLGMFFLQKPDDFFAPMNRASILGGWLTREVEITGQPAWAILLDQVKLGFLAFTEVDLRAWYLPETPLLRGGQALLFLIGLVLLLFRIKEKQTGLLLPWLLAFVGIIAFSESTPAAQRLVGVVPACAMVIAFALDRVVELASQGLPKASRVLPLLALLVCAALAVDDARQYFFEYTPRSDFGGRNTMVAQKLADTLQSYDSSWTVVFMGWPEMNYDSIKSTQFLAPHISGISLEGNWGDPTDQELPSGKKIFVFLPNHDPDLLLAVKDHPDGITRLVRMPDGESLFTMLQVEK